MKKYLGFIICIMIVFAIIFGLHSICTQSSEYVEFVMEEWKYDFEFDGYVYLLRKYIYKINLEDKTITKIQIPNEWIPIYSDITTSLVFAEKHESPDRVTADVFQYRNGEKEYLKTDIVIHRDDELYGFFDGKLYTTAIIKYSSLLDCLTYEDGVIASSDEDNVRLAEYLRKKNVNIYSRNGEVDIIWMGLGEVGFTDEISLFENGNLMTFQNQSKHLYDEAAFPSYASTVINNQIVLFKPLSNFEIPSVSLLEPVAYDEENGRTHEAYRQGLHYVYNLIALDEQNRSYDSFCSERGDEINLIDMAPIRNHFVYSPTRNSIFVLCRYANPIENYINLYGGSNGDTEMLLEISLVDGSYSNLYETGYAKLDYNALWEIEIIKSGTRSVDDELYNFISDEMAAKYHELRNNQPLKAEYLSNGCMEIWPDNFVIVITTE